MWHEPDLKRTIGAARNWLCEHARGQIVAHFDDDDFSAPGRLEDQLASFGPGVEVVAYCIMRFTDGRKWWMYTAPPHCAIGSSLCYRRSFWERNRFPDEQIGEDKALIEAAYKIRSLVTAPAGEQMWASIHPGNTSARRLKAKEWRELK